MQSERIPDEDSIYRQCIFPVSHKGKKFDYGKSFRLSEEGNLLITSVSWERYVPTVGHVHEYGCRLAEKRNISSSQNKTLQVYCGSYEISANAIRTINTEHGLPELSDADVIHAIEDGEIAHANMTFTLLPDIIDKEGTKTAIVDRLWHSVRGPLRHECKGETKEERKFEDLPDSPSGLYIDKRTKLSRLWFVIRFYCIKLFGVRRNAT